MSRALIKAIVCFPLLCVSSLSWAQDMWDMSKMLDVNNPTGYTNPVSPLNPNGIIQQDAEDRAREHEKACLEKAAQKGLNADNKILIEWLSFDKKALQGTYYDLTMQSCVGESCSFYGSGRYIDSDLMPVLSGTIDKMTLSAEDIGCELLKTEGLITYVISLRNNGWTEDSIESSVGFTLEEVLASKVLTLNIGENATIQVQVK